MCHVASHGHAMCHLTRCLEKREILIVSESDEVKRGDLILRDKFNGEVRFVIRDLYKFLFSTEITVLPLLRKIEFFSGFTFFPP